MYETLVGPAIYGGGGTYGSSSDGGDTSGAIPCQGAVDGKGEPVAGSGCQEATWSKVIRSGDLVAGGPTSLFDGSNSFQLAGTPEAPPDDVSTKIRNTFAGLVNSMDGVTTDTGESGTSTSGRFGTYYTMVHVSRTEMSASTDECLYAGQSLPHWVGYGPYPDGGCDYNWDGTLGGVEVGSKECIDTDGLGGRAIGCLTPAATSVPLVPRSVVRTTKVETSGQTPTVAQPYPWDISSRKSRFTAQSVRFESPSTYNRDATQECTVGAGTTKEADYTCGGSHHCPGEVLGSQGFSDTCVDYEYNSNYYHIGGEPGVPDPGNNLDAGSSLLDSFACKDDTTENIVIGVDGAGEPLCLFNPVTKDAGGEVSIVADSDALRLQDVLFYTPVYYVDAAKKHLYTIRMTLLSHWALLFGALRPVNQGDPVDITGFTVPDDYINLAYYWDDTAGTWVHPDCQPTVSAVAGCGFSFGTVVDSTYHALTAPCQYQAGQTCGATTQTQSLAGVINVHESIARFVTQVNIDRITNLGVLQVFTQVASEDVHVAMLGQSCFNQGSSGTFLIQPLQFTGPESAFSISVSMVEYQTNLGTLKFRPIANCDTASATPDNLPGPPCGLVPATTDGSGFQAIVANKVAIDSCTLIAETNGVVQTTTVSCASGIVTLNGAPGNEATSRQVNVIYAITQSAGVHAQRSHTIDCSGVPAGSLLCTLGFDQGLVDRLGQCTDDAATGTTITVSMKTNLVAKSLAVVAMPAANTLDGVHPCRVDPNNAGQHICPGLLHDQCISATTGVPSVQHFMKVCGEEFSGESTVELVGFGADGESQTPAAAGATPAQAATVLGNGMGYLHLGSIAGPLEMPVTIGQAKRHMIFPVQAKVTMRCGDTSGAPDLELMIMGGKDGQTWNVDATTWTEIMGLDNNKYLDVKNLVEGTPGIFDNLDSTGAPLYGTTAAGGYDSDGFAAINSPSWHKFLGEQAGNCHPNDVKEYTYHSQTGQVDHCATHGGNPCTSPGDSSVVVNTDAQGTVVLAGSGQVEHGLQCSGSGASGPAMIIEFNDQRPQYMGTSIEDPDTTIIDESTAAADLQLCTDQTLDDDSMCDSSVTSGDEPAHDVCTSSAGYTGCVFDPMLDADLDLPGGGGTVLSNDYTQVFKTGTTPGECAHGGVQAHPQTGVPGHSTHQCRIACNSFTDGSGNPCIAYEYDHQEEMDCTLFTGGTVTTATGSSDFHCYSRDVQSHSFYSHFKENDLAGNSAKATVLSAVGVLINSAYLHQSQCTNDVTTWGLEVQYVHLGGVALSSAGTRRSLADANISYFTARSAKKLAPPSNSSNHTRRLAEDETEAEVFEARPENASLVTTGSATMVKPCHDELGAVQGVYTQACLCLDKENPKSAQCAVEFYREVSSGDNNGTDDGGDDDSDDDSDAMAGIWLGILALICMVCFVMRTQKEEEKHIDELRRSLVPRGAHRA